MQKTCNQVNGVQRAHHNRLHCRMLEPMNIPILEIFLLVHSDIEVRTCLDVAFHNLFITGQSYFNQDVNVNIIVS